MYDLNTLASGREDVKACRVLKKYTQNSPTLVAATVAFLGMVGIDLLPFLCLRQCCVKYALTWDRSTKNP
jgi:hypothetical protein